MSMLIHNEQHFQRSVPKERVADHPPCLSVRNYLHLYTEDLLVTTKAIKRADELRIILVDFFLVLINLEDLDNIQDQGSEDVLYKSFLLNTIGMCYFRGV